MKAPRNVRSAYLTAKADGRESTVSIGPRGREGHLEGTITLRTLAGKASEPIEFDGALGVGLARARLIITIPASFDVEYDVEPSGLATGDRRLIIRAN